MTVDADFAFQVMIFVAFVGLAAWVGWRTGGGR